MKNTIPMFGDIKIKDSNEKIKKEFIDFITKELKKHSDKKFEFEIPLEFYSNRKILIPLLKEKNWKSRWKYEGGGGNDGYAPDICQLRLSYKQYYTKHIMMPC